MQGTMRHPAKRLSLLERYERWLGQERNLGPVLVAPAILVLVVLIGYPFCVAIYLSLTNRVIASAETDFIGLGNFIKLLGDSVFRRTAVNTFNYAFVSVAFKLILGMMMALVLDQVKFLKNFFRGILLLPWIVPTSLSTLGWLWMFDSQYSIFNRLLMDIGLIHEKIIWLGTPFWAMFSVQVVNIWRGIPFFGISLLAGIQAVPQELYEAAQIDGAGGWSRFWKITLPLIMPITSVVTLYSLIQTFADFQIVYVLTRGGPVNSTQLFATLTYDVAIRGMQLGEGAAISLWMFPVFVVFIIWQLRYLQRD
jgi:multiple sugar transport system permease protein